jgi:hypothetical protein
MAEQGANPQSSIEEAFLLRLAAAFQLRGRNEQEKMFNNIKDPNGGSKYIIFLLQISF